MFFNKAGIILEETNPEIAKNESKTGGLLKCDAKNSTFKRIQYEIPFFSINSDFDGFYTQFLKTDLSKIHLSTPFSELGLAFKLKDSQKGTHCYFSPKGKITHVPN